MIDQQHISDDLVLYALRELPEQQASEIRRHLDDCPQCRRELGDINSDMALMALSVVGPTPPQRSRERLLKAIKAEPRRQQQQVVIQRPWWSLVPSFAAVVLAAFALLMWREDSSLRHRLEAAQQEAVVRQAELERTQAELERSQLVLDTLTSPESTHFALVATKSQPVPEGHASYLQRTGTLVFTAEHLLPLPANKTYELWLIPASGSAPMPFGTFKPDAHGNASMVMPNMNKTTPKMFAVTIELEGGSQTPTMPIVMAGA